MTDDPTRWYPSKVDWWLAVLLWMPPVATVTVSVALLQDGASDEFPWLICVLALEAVIYLGLVFPMRYGISDTHLVVRFGLMRHRVLLRDIRDVHPSHNPLSSPALSLDRLHVQYGDGLFKAVMISPADRDRFLTELSSRAGMTREGDRLVRPALRDGNSHGCNES